MKLCWRLVVLLPKPKFRLGSRLAMLGGEASRSLLRRHPVTWDKVYVFRSECRIAQSLALRASGGLDPVVKYVG